MPADLAQFPVANGPGSVAQAPDLPAGFAATFSSRFIETAGLRQHAVVGGSGPAVLLIHGWPENWYAWRFVMPSLAQNHTVIAVDQRGLGLTGKPDDGYDAGTLAGDLIALMDVLGHERFAVIGHDTGVVAAYALAADHPDRVDRLAVAEIPGPPGAVPAPPLFVPGPLNDKVWHIPFNRAGKVAEQLVQGKEHIFFGYEFAIQGGKPLSETVIDYYVQGFTNPESLRGCFGFYRAWDATMAQNKVRATQPLPMPVLAIGGADSWADHVADGMRPVAANVQGAVIAAAGHWVAEQAPEELLPVLTTFLTD
ncbi:alpha/beta hydrolase [Kribbella sp. NPDC026611]|uniref:alpha/beta fold hydrolase n=1 Tax=Kribbella sp. NPDC026611 TaxID=3154911 RepID=UPI0033F42FC2